MKLKGFFFNMIKYFFMRWVIVVWSIIIIALFVGSARNIFLVNIISNRPEFAFIESKDFYQSYYNQRNTIVLDLRDYRDYKNSHIDNSVYFNIENIFETYEGIPRKIKRVNDLIYTISNLGITAYGVVGIYSEKIEDSLVLASILHIFKVEKVFVIKDGFQGWKNNKLPISNKIKLIDKGYFPYKITKSFYESVIWEIDKVRDSGDKYSLVFVSSEAKEKISAIPNSIIVRPKFDFNRYVIGSYYNSYDISRDKKILLYGNDNYEVLQVYFVLAVFLNYPNVYIFNGGINEWIANNLPTN